MFGVAALVSLTWLGAANLFAPLARETISGPPASPELVASDGRLLFLGPTTSGERCAPRSLVDVDPIVGEVFVASEDRRFHDHRGVDLRALARAAWVGHSGASTLSMQLARLIWSHPRTLLGKLEEARLALRLERTLSKDEILEQYLNRVPLGRNIRGVEAAAWTYFGHSSRQMTLGEAALLAAMAPAPSRLDPRFALEAAGVARNRLLLRLEAQGSRTHKEVGAAISEPLALPPGVPRHILSIVGPALPNGRTTLFLEPRLQSAVERVVASHRQRLATLDVDAVAVVVIAHDTNSVVAHVGSLDFDDPVRGQVDHSRARRQAGSTLKPFLYALRVEDGATPDTLVPDTFRAFREGNRLFIPSNLDENFRGVVPLQVALGSSLNVPAVWTAERVGLDRFRQTLDVLGLDLRGATRDYGLGLALGDADVCLLDLTSAFTVFSRGGFWSPARLTYSSEPPSDRRVIPEEVARIIRDILSEEATREPGFGSLAHLGLPFRVALKTGTSSSSRDFWALGSTEALTVGIWAGNSSGMRAADAVSAEVAVPILVDVLAAIVDTPPDQRERATAATRGPN